MNTPEPISPQSMAPEELAFDVHALPGGLPAALEAVLMVAEEPISTTRLAAVLGVPVSEVEGALAELVADFSGTDAVRPRGFELRQAGGGWRFYSAPMFHEVVARFVTDGQSARLTQAALETLAVVAYRQPVARAQISSIRGVNVDGVVRTLVTRGLIEEVATDESSGAILYGTSSEFLEKMGLNSLDELPPLAPHLPELDAAEGYGDVASLDGGAR